MFVKRADRDYNDDWCVEEVIRYIYTENGNGNVYIGGLNVLDPINAAAEFNMVKDWYRKNSGVRIRHYIISVEPRDLFIPYMCAELAYLVCAFYAGQFQSVFSVHTNTRFTHIHIVINTVSFVDGKKLHEGIGDIKRFESYCYKCYAKVKGKYKWVDTALRSF